MSKTTTEVVASPSESPAALVPADMLHALPSLMERALAAGPDGVAALERLVALHGTLKADAAREAFFHALAQFQSECPPVPKNRVAIINSKGGNGYSYRFADFEMIVRTVRPVLQKHGLSFSFDSRQEGGLISVTCRIRHEQGHSETATFTCPTSSPSGQMSEQQKVGGALTFAKRYALTAALGIATADEDTDAREDHADEEPALDQEAIDVLEERLHALGVDRAAFLRYFRLEAVTDLPPSRLKEAHKILDRKARNQEKAS